MISRSFAGNLGFESTLQTQLKKALKIGMDAGEVFEGESMDIWAYHGTPPYAFSFLINESNATIAGSPTEADFDPAVYTAGNTAGTDTVLVEGAIQSALASINVLAPPVVNLVPNGDLTDGIEGWSKWLDLWPPPACSNEFSLTYWDFGWGGFSWLKLSPGGSGPGGDCAACQSSTFELEAGAVCRVQLIFRSNQPDLQIRVGSDARSFNLLPTDVDHFISYSFTQTVSQLTRIQMKAPSRFEVNYWTTALKDIFVGGVLL